MKTLLIKIDENEKMDLDLFEFVDKSRIDGQHVYRFKDDLPDFEVIQTMSFEVTEKEVTKEEEFVEWLLNEMNKNNIYKINLCKIDLVFDLAFLSFNIDNMNVDFSNKSVKIRSDKNLFDNKYDLDLVYNFEDSDLYYDTYSKIYKKLENIDKEENEKHLDKFFEKISTHNG